MAYLVDNEKILLRIVLLIKSDVKNSNTTRSSSLVNCLTSANGIVMCILCIEARTQACTPCVKGIKIVFAEITI